MKNMINLTLGLMIAHEWQEEGEQRHCAVCARRQVCVPGDDWSSGSWMTTSVGKPLHHWRRRNKAAPSNLNRAACASASAAGEESAVLHN